MRAFAHLSTFVLCAVAPELADVGRPALLPDRGHGAPRLVLEPDPLLPNSPPPRVLTFAPRCSQVVEWDEVRFDVRLMQRVPVQKTFDLNHSKDAVEVRAPGESTFRYYSSYSQASRAIQTLHTKRISPQSISQFIRKNPKGGTIRIRQNAGWSFRPSRA